MLIITGKKKKKIGRGNGGFGCAALPRLQVFHFNHIRCVAIMTPFVIITFILPFPYSPSLPPPIHHHPYFIIMMYKSYPYIKYHAPV